MSPSWNRRTGNSRYSCSGQKNKNRTNCSALQVSIAFLWTLVLVVLHVQVNHLRVPLLASPSSDTNDQKCEVMLDQFDVTFDERRRARQQKVSQNIGVYNQKKPFFDLYEPEATCFTDERFGLTNVPDRNAFTKVLAEEDLPGVYKSAKRYDSFGDGPKFVCGLDVIGPEGNKENQQDKCLVYSIGSNNDVSFEMTVHKFLGCEIHTFDPTITNFIGGNYAKWHPWGLGEDGVKVKSKDKEWKGKSFDTIIKELDHRYRIDRDGCEWSTMIPLFDLITAGTVKVNQILVEIHVFNTLKVSSDQRDTFFTKMDQAKMRIFHKERNHWGCNGFECLEYALVSEEFLRIANKVAVCL